MSSLTLYRALEAYDAHKSINLIWVDPDTDNDTMEKINSDNAFTLSTGDMVFICDNVKKRVPGSSMYTVYTDDDGNTTGEDFKGRKPDHRYDQGRGRKPYTDCVFPVRSRRKVAGQLHQVHHQPDQLQLRRQGTEPVGN